MNEHNPTPKRHLNSVASKKRPLRVFAGPGDDEKFYARYNPTTGEYETVTIPHRPVTWGKSKYDPNGRKYTKEHTRADGIHVPRKLDHRLKHDE